RILNQLQQDLRLRHGRVQFDSVLAHLNHMITDLAAFSGMEMENMTRGHGWRFLDIGRRLERALNMATLLRGSLSVGGQHAILGPRAGGAAARSTWQRCSASRCRSRHITRSWVRCSTSPTAP